MYLSLMYIRMNELKDILSRVDAINSKVGDIVKAEEVFKRKDGVSYRVII